MVNTRLIQLRFHAAIHGQPTAAKRHESQFFKHVQRKHKLHRVKPKRVASFRKLFRVVSAQAVATDAEDYYRLYMDDELNKWWGYDYREDLNGETPSPEYFFRFQKNLKDIKEEYSLAVKENGKMVGELVLHNFDFRGGVEMGYRFFKECHGKGYATESALALKKFVIENLKPNRLKTRCFKQNIPSKNLIGRIGFTDWYQTETHFFFKIDF